MPLTKGDRKLKAQKIISPWRQTEEKWSMLPRNAGSHKKKQEDDSPQMLPEENMALVTDSYFSGLHNCERKMSCFKLSNLWQFVTTTTEN